MVGVDRRCSGVGVRRYDMEKLWGFFFSFYLAPTLRADMHVVNWRMGGGAAYRYRSR